MINLSGKGIYLWIIKETDNPVAIAAKCFAAGLTHVLIKIADYKHPYNVTDKGVDLVPPLIKELRAVGISPWGWQFVYGNDPDGEAAIAVSRSKELGVDGFVVNAEGAYKGKNAAAVKYMQKVRAGLGGLMPIGLSSFRYPELHPEFPWKDFLGQVDINLPQVYWILSHNPAAQMVRCYEEFKQSKYPQVPIFPTGAAFSEQGWRASASEVTAFMEQVKALGLAGCNFWRYADAIDRYPDLREAITGFEWETGAVVEPEPIEEPVELPDGVLFYAKCTARVKARIRVSPDGVVIGYLDRGLVEPVYGVIGSWYRIGGGYVGETLMEKMEPPVIEEPVEEPVEGDPTVEERLDRVEADLDKVLDWIAGQDPEAFDA